MTEDKIKRVQLILDYCDRGIMSAQIFANNTNTDINDVPCTDRLFRQRHSH